jgi:hypothetical protein
MAAADVAELLDEYEVILKAAYNDEAKSSQSKLATAVTAKLKASSHREDTEPGKSSPGMLAVISVADEVALGLRALASHAAAEPLGRDPSAGGLDSGKQQELAALETMAVRVHVISASDFRLRLTHLRLNSASRTVIRYKRRQRAWRS